MRLTMKLVRDGAIVTTTIAARGDGIDRTCSQFFELTDTVQDIETRMAAQVARALASDVAVAA